MTCLLLPRERSQCMRASKADLAEPQPRTTGLSIYGEVGDAAAFDCVELQPKVVLAHLKSVYEYEINQLVMWF